ncbi:DegT/DnrJ/EryC1/StrS family aminotransferase, partial [Rhodopseudomonas sp. B29]|uniref:DegT/DnrJ/EryC1/StrS family aminotransferase n=1 Tax=Rhodopseudomonas sp. B29 TaxID=95607 RepID=UPI0019011C98
MAAKPDTTGTTAAAAPGLALYRGVTNGIPADLAADLLQPPLRDPKVRYRDLAVDDDLRARLLEVVDDMLRGGRLLMGPACERWEELIGEYCGARHCVSVASGTSAIYLAL